MANAVLITASGRVVIARNGGVATNSVSTPVGTVPGIPTGLAVGTITPSSVALSWGAPTSGTPPFTGYSVIYATSSSGPWTTFGTSSSTSAVVTGLSPATLYYFAVAAINSIGTGPYTSPVSATTAASIPVLSSVSPNSGTTAGGTPLTLTGSNFSTATSVTIGGLAVSFSIVNNTTITFASPAHAAGATSIAVTGPGGTSGSVTFTYSTPISGAAPVWSTVNPWVVQPAAGAAITVTGSGFTGGSIIDPGSGLPIPSTVVNDSKITFAKPATDQDSFPYEFFVRNTAGDSSRFGLITGITSSAATTIDDPTAILLASSPMTVYGYTYPFGTPTQIDVKLWSDGTVVHTQAVTPTSNDGSWSLTFNAPTPGTYYLHSATLASGSDFWTGAFSAVSSLTAPFLNDVNPFAKVPGLAAPIVITGSKFTGATAVKFGSVAAPSFTVVDDATIKLPSAPDQPFGPVNVTIVGASGEVSSPANFQYLHAIAEPVPQSVGGAAPVVPSRWKGPWTAAVGPKPGQVTSVIIDPVHGNTSGTGSDGVSSNLWSGFDFQNPAALGYPRLADGGTVTIRAGTFTAGPWAQAFLADFPGGINIIGAGANQVTFLNIGNGPGGDKAMSVWHCNTYIYGVNFQMDGVDEPTSGYGAMRFYNIGTDGSSTAHYIHIEKCRFNQCQEAIVSDTGWTVTGENWCLYLKNCDFSPLIPNAYNSDILAHEVYSGAQQFWENCNSYGPKYGTTHKGRSPSMTIVGCWTRRGLNRWIDYPESGVFQAWNSTFTEMTPQYGSGGGDTDLHLFEYCSSTPNLTAAPTSPLFNNCDFYFSRGVDISDGAARAEDWMTPLPINFVNCRPHWCNPSGGSPPRLIAVDPGDFSTHNDRIVGIPLTNPGTTFETLPAAPAFRTP